MGLRPLLYYDIPTGGLGPLMPKLVGLSLNINGVLEMLDILFDSYNRKQSISNSNN